MSAVNILSGEGGGIAGRCGDRVQQCWQFEHPRRDLILDTSGQYFLLYHARLLVRALCLSIPVTDVQEAHH
jgi:hypothetical protein